MKRILLTVIAALFMPAGWATSAVPASADSFQEIRFHPFARDTRLSTRVLLNTRL